MERFVRLNYVDVSSRSKWSASFKVKDGCRDSLRVRREAPSGTFRPTHRQNLPPNHSPLSEPVWNIR